MVTCGSYISQLCIGISELWPLWTKTNPLSVGTCFICVHLSKPRSRQSIQLYLCTSRFSRSFGCFQLYLIFVRYGCSYFVLITEYPDNLLYISLHCGRPDDGNNLNVVCFLFNFSWLSCFLRNSTFGCRPPTSTEAKLIYSWTDWLTYWLTIWLADSLPPSLPLSLTHSLNHSLTHTLTHSFIVSFTHSLTHSLILYLIVCNSQT